MIMNSHWQWLLFVLSTCGRGLGLRYTWRVTKVGVGDEYKSFFRTSPEVGVPTPWTLEVNTEIFGLDFITFFATDHHRCVSSVLNGI